MEGVVAEGFPPCPRRIPEIGVKVAGLFRQVADKLFHDAPFTVFGAAGGR